ncbi:tripartite motif-containing protein 16-like protein [Onychostoma macrolepis]|uniref:tripartite motif-containing protein 16-like protein n=1 Tax=Onychostoma macrolepis TaxID=369639 RepID=UPI002729A921|nr:tripartite motif-containing protein 16-like protein [Onychostoma macrolepis]
MNINHVVCVKSSQKYSEMAEGNISMEEDQLKCPVCLDLLKEPVTIPCGHSYCKRCITDCWDEEDRIRCPQCRQTFGPRPVLGKNVVIADMVEKLKKTRLQAAGPAVHHTGPGDVQCNSCTGFKQKAVISCLECRSSYCQNHLQHHENLFRGKKHNLIDATGRLQEMICLQHDKMLEIYCRTDQQCVCMLCLVDEHKNHDTVSTATAITEKQSHLEKNQRKIIQPREKDRQELRGAVASHKRSAQTAVEDSERIFAELIRSIEKRCSEVKQLIRDQERAAVSRAEERLARLKKINDLKRRNMEMKLLSETRHHVRFLQDLLLVFQCLSDGFTGSSYQTFDAVVKSVSQLRLQFCKEETEKKSGTMTTVQVILAPEYHTRRKFLQYYRLLTLDPNSVNNWLRLSEGNTVITYADKHQRYPDHPDRFDCWANALCRESVTGRCYWEVEWSCSRGRLGVSVAVAYKSIRRKGQEPEILAGLNNQSWSLFCSPDSCSLWHNNFVTELPVASSCRIGVYVDHSAGILSFYSVSDTMSLIHRVQTTFTQPLCALFGVNKHSRLKLCRLTPFKCEITTNLLAEAPE